MRATMWAAFWTCALVPPVHSESAAPATVGVAIADKLPIARTIDFVGRVERSTVWTSGRGSRVTARPVQEGTRQEGAALYRIEKGLFQAAVEQRRARWKPARRNTSWRSRTASARRSCTPKCLAPAKPGRSRRIGG